MFIFFLPLPRGGGGASGAFGDPATAERMGASLAYSEPASAGGLASIRKDEERLEPITKENSINKIPTTKT